MKDDPETLSYAGPEMRALRESLGQSQPDWAKLLRTSQKRISDYERNVRRTPAHLLLLARLVADPRARVRFFQEEVPKRR